MTNWFAGQVILGEYLIEKELGKGGMGRVWLVKSNSTGRQFAIKQTILKDDKSRKAFLAELQTWIDLPEHPNIVPCRFFRTVGDEIVIFTDYIDGGSLKDWIDQGKLTTLEQSIYSNPALRAKALDVLMGHGYGKAGFSHLDGNSKKSILRSVPFAAFPQLVALMNEGVKLALKNTSSCDHLSALRKKGTRILVCGTCTNHFGITADIGAGVISNMFEITEALLSADKILSL